MGVEGDWRDDRRDRDWDHSLGGSGRRQCLQQRGACQDSDASGHARCRAKLIAEATRLVERETREADLRTRNAAPTKTPIPPPYELALISGKCTSRSDIGFTECEGFVKNISGKTLENVTVVIEWSDANGTGQASDDALIDYNPILAGQESPWKTIGTYNPALTGFRVTFKELLGGTILTRDDR